MRQDFTETLSATIIKNLEKRSMKGYYCATKEEAKELALSLVESGKSVSSGGSMTLEECGVIAGLRERTDITLIDRATATSPEEVTQMYHDALSADYYFMSTNAITDDGVMINTDGNGNRVAALIYGPEKVIIVCGMNKVCHSVAAAMERVKNIAAPPNCMRLNRNTPCAATGTCHDCLSPDCICCQTVITRLSRVKDRIEVILVGEELGY